MEPCRILLADDHVIFREMIKKSLDEIPGLEVVGEASDGLEVLKSVEKLKPRMVILDIGMPHMSGLEAASQIKQTYPEIKVLLLTMYKSKDHLSRAMEAGGDGYVLKENAFKDLIAAIETIREGNPYISILVTQPMLDSLIKKSRPTPESSSPLSPREQEVLKHLAEGESHKEIAGSLFISESTVRIHIKNIKRKLLTKSNVDLVRYALSQGYASLT